MTAESCPICGGCLLRNKNPKTWRHQCPKAKIAHIESERAEQDDDGDDLGRFGRCQGCNKKLVASDDWRSGYCSECD